MGMFFIAAMIAAAATSAAVDAARLEALPSGMTERLVRSFAMAFLMVVASRATARVGMDAGVRDDGTPRAPRTSRVGPWIDVALYLWVLWGGHWAQAAWVLSGEHLVPAMLLAWLPWALASLSRGDAERRIKAEFHGRPFGGAERRSALGLGARIRALFALPMLLSAGIEPSAAAEVATWVAKEGLRSNPGTQALEDAACLVFLENEIGAFAAAHADYPREKFIEILRKTWRKMSPAAHAAALGLELPPAIAELVRAATAVPTGSPSGN